MGMGLQVSLNANRKSRVDDLESSLKLLSISMCTFRQATNILKITARITSYNNRIHAKMYKHKSVYSFPGVVPVG